MMLSNALRWRTFLDNCSYMQKRVTPRRNMVAAELQKIVSSFLLSDAHMEYGGMDPHMISVTGVDVSPCLRHMKVFIAPLKGEKESALQLLDANKARLRHYISTHMRLKYTPDIMFILDTTFDYAQRIEELLRT